MNIYILTHNTYILHEKQTFNDIFSSIINLEYDGFLLFLIRLKK